MTESPYTSESLPQGDYAEYVKVRPTLAIRMPGPFSCLTSEGNVASCADGWLAVDSRGFPYPVNAAEFLATYRRRNRDA